LIYLPAGLPHQLTSSDSTTTRLLVLLTGGDLENAFIEAAGGDVEAMERAQMIAVLPPAGTWSRINATGC
jgi:hypothetical protein